MQHQFELWPCHPHPLPDELLSCWLVRIAHAHRVKVQTFCERVFGRERQVWNRDIDRLAPRWIINRLSIQTGTPLADAHQTALTAYRGLLYPRRKDSGILRWILPLDIWHRKHMGHGLQFCPVCLAEDPIPYYRKRWRLALYTCCSEHNAMLHDRCPVCGAGVAFHRIELGHYGSADEGPLAYCNKCGFDLRNAPTIEPTFYEDSSQQVMLEVLRMFEGKDAHFFDAGFFTVLHQMCKLLLSNTQHTKLRTHVISLINASDLKLQTGKKGCEERPIWERHHIVQLGMWLMVNPGQRIVEAWRNKVLRYNILLKGLKDPPRWFRKAASHCSDWRSLVSLQ
jgi:hypothetical protein